MGQSARTAYPARARAGCCPSSFEDGFGDDAPCHGYLVGEPHKGLKYMFQMMNESRVGVVDGIVPVGLVVEGSIRSLGEREPPQVVIQQDQVHNI